MANTQYFELSYSLEDGAGLRANMVLYGLLDPTQTITAILTEATAQAALLNGVSDCKILASSVRVNVPLPDQSSFPANAVQAEKTMLLSFTDNRTPPRTYGQDTPGVANGILATPDTVDVTDAAYQAWRDSFTSAGTHWQLTDQTQDLLVAARKVAVTFRKHRRALSGISAEAAG